MRALIERLHNFRFLVLSMIAALLACVILPADAFKEVTQELMALFGLMMAGILPTMVLTASALRAGNLSIRRVSEYHAALKRQMKVWIGLFVLALCASVLVVAGKMVSWTIPLSIPSFPQLSFAGVRFDLIRVVNALIAGSGAMMILRGFSLGRGIMSLLELSSEIAKGEAHVRDEERHRIAEAQIAQISDRPNFGEYVELKH